MVLIKLIITKERSKIMKAIFFIFDNVMKNCNVKINDFSKVDYRNCYASNQGFPYLNFHLTSEQIMKLRNSTWRNSVFII